MPLSAAVHARFLAGNKIIVIKGLGSFGKVDERIGEFLDPGVTKPPAVLE